MLMPGAGELCKLKEIAPHPVEAVLPAVAEQVDSAGSKAMSPVVIGIYGITGCGERRSEPGIPCSRLTHTVCDLHNPRISAPGSGSHS